MPQHHRAQFDNLKKMRMVLDMVVEFQRKQAQLVGKKLSQEIDELQKQYAEGNKRIQEAKQRYSPTRADREKIAIVYNKIRREIT